MLTNKEQEAFQIIETYIQNNSHSPTYDDIASEMGLKNRSSIVRYINGLQDKGYIRVPEGKRKSIEILGQQSTLPLVGTIAAGQPLEAYETIEQVDLHSFLELPNQYLLEVKGSSMQKCGIQCGDLVLIKKQEIAREGQIVVALIDNGEATLKEFAINKDNTVSLIPHSDEHEVQIYPMDRVSIQGVYQGLRIDKSYMH
tara:strand:+ start:6342 stop:6938 length:597 start_codon:yes stop_codon:yes gene_type:complete